LGIGQLSCPNGHVGALTVSAEEAAVIRARELGHDVETPEQAAAVGQPATTAETMVNGGHKEKTVEEISAELNKTIREERDKELEDEAKRIAHNPTDWGDVKESDPDPAFAAIVEKVFVRNPEELADRLEAALTIGDRRTDYGSMMRYLDEAERNARDAHRLWQTAIAERKRWEADNEVVWATMRSQATRALQHEKEEKSRSKQITDADVESRMATLFPDQYRRSERSRVRMKAMVDSMQNLAEVWLLRIRTLQTILSKQR
jgi:hypothetical protein